MLTIVLNYNNGITYLINHSKEDDVEALLFEKYDFNESYINRMTTENLQIETLQ